MKISAVLVLLLVLTGCSLPVFFRVPVVQGNIVTAKEVNKLELGMSRRQVAYVMGTPLVDTSFEKDRWDYVFYYRDPRAHVRHSKLNLYFVNDKLADIEGNEAYTRQADNNAEQILRDEPAPSEVTPGPNNEPFDPDADTTSKQRPVPVDEVPSPGQQQPLP